MDLQYSRRIKSENDRRKKGKKTTYKNKHGMTSSRVQGEQATVLNLLTARKFTYQTTSDKGRGKKREQKDNSALDSFSKFQLPIFTAEPTSLHRFYLFKSVYRA